MQTNITKAVLLAAGRGTRMRKLTQELPKPMLQVRGKPVLQHIVEGLRDAGLTDILVSLAGMLRSFAIFLATAPNSACASNTRRRSFQMARAKLWSWRASLPATDPFVLSYGDILIAPENYPRICATLAGAEAVVSVKRNEDVTQGGAVFVNENFELIDLREKPKPGEPTSPWYNAGIYAFRSSIFEYIAKLERSPRGEFELTDAIRNLALAGTQSAGARINRRLGRCARSGNSRAVERVIGAAAANDRVGV